MFAREAIEYPEESDLAVNVKRGLRAKAQMGWYPVQPPLGVHELKNEREGKQYDPRGP